jgi:hypothetical protein
VDAAALIALAAGGQALCVDGTGERRGLVALGAKGGTREWFSRAGAKVEEQLIKF